MLRRDRIARPTSGRELGSEPHPPRPPPPARGRPCRPSGPPCPPAPRSFQGAGPSQAPQVVPPHLYTTKHEDTLLCFSYLAVFHTGSRSFSQIHQDKPKSRIFRAGFTTAQGIITRKQVHSAGGWRGRPRCPTSGKGPQTSGVRAPHQLPVGNPHPAGTRARRGGAGNGRRRKSASGSLRFLPRTLEVSAPLWSGPGPAPLREGRGRWGPRNP